jgi:hypothetical protein
MKKLILFVGMLLTGIFANAQMVLGTSVPKVVKDKFDAQFVNASMVTWEKEGNNYEADFKLDGTSMEAVYTPEGVYVQKEISIENADLPTATREYLGKNYPGKKITECTKIVKADGKVFYEAEVEENEMTFDTNGNYLSSKKEKGVVK